MCRICFSGEEDGAKGADRLFSPCQCRGSQGLVHVRCLNHWRARSRNNASYFTCNTCHYRYNLERAAWAKRIEDPRLLAAVSLFIVSVIVAATGVAVTFVASRVLAPAFANLAVFCRTRGIRSGALTYVEHLGNPRPSHHWRSAVTEAYQIPNVDSKSPELRAAVSADDLDIDMLEDLMRRFVKDAEAGTHAAAGWPNTGYGVSKVGVIAMTRVLARDEPGIAFNTVDPGYCATDQNANHGHDPASLGAETSIHLAGSPEPASAQDQRELDWTRT